MKQFLALIIFLGTFLNVSYTQVLRVNVDSVLQVYQNTNLHDTTRLLALDDLVCHYNSVDLQEAKKYVGLLLEMSQKTKQAYYEGRAYMLTAQNIQRSNADSDSIIMYFDKAIAFAKEIDSYRLVASSSVNLGNHYLYLKQYDKALTAYKVGLENAQIGHKRIVPAVLYSIAEIFAKKKNNKQAINYNQRALKIALETNDDIFLDYIYRGLGNAYFRANQLDSAEYYILEALDLMEKRKNEYTIAVLYIDLSHIFFEKGEEQKAVAYGLKSLALHQKLNYQKGILQSYSNLSEIELKRKNYKKAIQYVEAGREVDAKTAENVDFFQVLHQSYYHLGNYRKAYEYFDRYNTLQDSIFNEKSETTVRELEVKLEVAQKEQENQHLKAEQQVYQKNILIRNIIAVSLLLALILATSLGVVIYRSNLQKSRYNQELEEKVAERTKALSTANKRLKQANYELKTFNYIASHDIKEPIRNIGSYVGLIFRKLPSDLKESLGSYFTTIKKSSVQLYTLVEDFARYTELSQGTTIEKGKVNLNELIESLTHGLETTIEKYHGQIMYENLPTIQSSQSLLFFALKNLIENGLKYNKSAVPTVNIHYKQTPTHHQIIVSDNGIGIEEEFHEKIFEMFKRLHNRGEYEGSGIGLAIVKLVIEKLNGTVSVKSQTGNEEEQSGSDFILLFPK